MAWNMQKQEKKNACKHQLYYFFMFFISLLILFLETLNSLWPEQRKWVHASGNHSKGLWAVGSGHRLDVCSFDRHLT